MKLFYTVFRTVVQTVLISCLSDSRLSHMACKEEIPTPTPKPILSSLDAGVRTKQEHGLELALMNECLVNIL